MNNNYFGKFRGIVTDINDPDNIGRIKARVADITGSDETGWAMPCAPFAGNNMGLFVLPEVGSGVWIEFEHGDADYPIWSGSWWGSSSDVPSVLSSPKTYKKSVIRTQGGHSIILDDNSNGGITIETSGGLKLIMDSQGIEINNGKGASIKLSGSSVKINDSALEIT